MKSILFRNKINGERFVCENIKAIETIDGVEYLVVHKEFTQRLIMVRKDTLEKVNQFVNFKKEITHK
jgi:hypothetical protein